MQAIEVYNVSKYYTILKEELSSHSHDKPGIKHGKQKLHKEIFYALKDVSFSVASSTMLGIIGDNGSGKSTILKLLAGISYPTTGEIKIQGRVAAMLELGVGFHPDLSGMENIFLNGSVLGLSHSQIIDNLDKIIGFSGIGDFIYSPVKHYSSGMFARLGFSIAIHADPDVLLVDEILAVGDAEFQMRCLEEIKRLRALGKTIVLVSHNISLVEMMCDKVLWLDHGSVKQLGAPTEICFAYRQSTEQFIGIDGVGEHPYFVAESGNIQPIAGLQGKPVLLDDKGNPQTSFQTGCKISIDVPFTTSQPIYNCRVSIIFKYTQRDIPVAEILSEPGDPLFSPLHKSGTIHVEIDSLALLEGNYEVSAILYNALDPSEVYGVSDEKQTISITSPGEYLPAYLVVKPPCRWSHICDKTDISNQR